MVTLVVERLAVMPVGQPAVDIAAVQHVAASAAVAHAAAVAAMAAAVTGKIDGSAA